MNSIQTDIITILKAYLHSDYTFTITNSIDDIYDLANKYAITPVIAYTLKKANFNNDDSCILKCAARFEKQNSLRNELKEVFDKHNIGYVYIKGITLAKYYDEEYLRFSSDVDVVVQKENYLKARDILVNEYGYKQNHYMDNELSLTSKNHVALDLHSIFGKYDDEIEAVYKDVNYNVHELNNELKLFHLCSHGAKHINAGFISMQFLIDLYYLEKLEFDRNVVYELLNKANLLSFYRKTVELIHVLFDDYESNEITDAYIEFLFNGKGLKGKENNTRIVRAKKNKTKFGYILTRLFPDYEFMCSSYPILLNKKYLLPIFYIYRVFDILFKKKHFNKVKDEFGYCLNDDKESINKTKKLFDELGI